MMRAVRLAAALATSTPALAMAQQASPPTDADELFRQGRRAVEAGDTAKGCRLLEQSLALDDATGTLLNVALCHEKLGRFAAAFREFQSVEERAVATAGPDAGARAAFARQHAEAIRPKVSWIEITRAVGDDRTGIVVRVDDGPPAYEPWPDVPVEPGAHVVAFTDAARADTPVRVSLSIAAAPARARVVVPLLVATRAKAEASVAPRPATHTRTLGFVTGGAGIALLASALVLGGAAIAQAGDATCAAPCPAIFTTGSTTFANPALLDARAAYDRSVAFADLSTVAAVLGLVGLGVGSYLVWSTRDRAQPVRRSWLARGVVGGTF